MPLVAAIAEIACRNFFHSWEWGRLCSFEQQSSAAKLWKKRDELPIAIYFQPGGCYIRRHNLFWVCKTESDMLGVDDLELAIRTSFFVLARGMVTAASGSEEPFTLQRSFGKCNPPPLSYWIICFCARNLSSAAIYLMYVIFWEKKTQNTDTIWVMAVPIWQPHVDKMTQFVDLFWKTKRLVGKWVMTTAWERVLDACCDLPGLQLSSDDLPLGFKRKYTLAWWPGEAALPQHRWALC